MARNYNSRRPAGRSSGTPQFLVIAATFLFGYFTACIFDIDTMSHWLNTQVLASHEVKQQVVQSQPPKAQVPPKPKFEFYTLLANEKTSVGAQAAANKPAVQPAKDTQVASAAVQGALNTHPESVKVVEGKPLAPKPLNTSNYLVQVASFKARSDAEHMKALLTLKGFEVSVVPVTQAQGNWFRVVIGPYPNRNLAQKAQGILARTEHLKGMVRSAT